MDKVTINLDDHDRAHVCVDGQDVLLPQPPEVVAFLADLVQTCQRHGLVLECDGTGRHTVEMYTSAAAMRLIQSVEQPTSV